MTLGRRKAERPLTGEMIACMASRTRRFQATLFLPEDVAVAIQSIRSEFDRESAQAIAPHVTVLYEDELASVDTLRERLTAIKANLHAFRVMLSEPRTWSAGPEGGIYLAVSDVDGGIAALRGLLLADVNLTPIGAQYQPHVTLVHTHAEPATCRRAWEFLRQWPEFTEDVFIESVAVIEEEAGAWRKRGAYLLK
jgi:2'-5' RNA ligase